MNRTLQGRLVNEFRVAGIRTLPRANAYLREIYLPQHNARFRRPPRDAASAFVPLGAVDLDAMLCVEDERIVAPDNTVMVGAQVLQIEPSPGRRSCAGLRVRVRQHLDGTVTITRPPGISLTYTAINPLARIPKPSVLPIAVLRKRGKGRWPKDLRDRVGDFL